MPFVSHIGNLVNVFAILLYHCIFISDSGPVKTEDVLDKQTRPELILSMATSFFTKLRDKILRM